jgi:DNA-binding beta-propeller fold protein YncE
MTFRRRTTRVALALGGALLLAHPAAAPAATGDLVQKAGRDGCTAIFTSATPDCAPGAAVQGFSAVAFSPDGRNLYASSDRVVAVVERSAGTGKLTSKGCFSREEISGATCEQITWLDDPRAVAVSPDGRSVYVTAGIDRIGVFDRDPGTGALTLKAGRKGCVQAPDESDQNPACTLGPPWLVQPSAITVAPDGKQVYVVYEGSAVVTFDRGDDGTLTLKPDTEVCAVAGCAFPPIESFPGSLVVAPDGRNVYVSVGSSLAVLDRDPGSGRLTEKQGDGACVWAYALQPCAYNDALRYSTAAAVSPDGRYVYVASASDKITVLRRGADGGVTAAGCVTLIAPADCSAPRSQVFRTRALVISGDGANVYAASDLGMTLFDRDPDSGQLSHKPGASGCVGAIPGCTSASLDPATALAVAPDGRNVYYFGSAIYLRTAVFDRQVAPVGTIASGPQGESNDPTPELTFASDTPGSRFECSADGGAFADCAGLSLADGPHSVRVRAVDRFGNVGPASAARDFSIDTTAPDTTIATGPQGRVLGRSASIAFGSGEAGASFECRLDGGERRPCSSPLALSGVREGAHSLEVRALDRLGNADPTPAALRFTVDATVSATVSARKTQRPARGKIALGVTLRAGEAVTAASQGTVKLGARSYALAAKTARVRAGGRPRLELTPKRAADARRIAQALRRRGTGRATLTVTLTDAVANRAVRTLRVTLKR